MVFFLCDFCRLATHFRLFENAKVAPLGCKSGTFGELTIRFGVFRVAENEEKVMVREVKIAQKGGQVCRKSSLIITFLDSVFRFWVLESIFFAIFESYFPLLTMLIFDQKSLHFQSSK